MNFKRIIAIAALLPLCAFFVSCNSSDPKAANPAMGVVAFTNGQSAAVVIGQVNFITTNAPNPTATSLFKPWGNVAITNGRLYIPDQGNNRILGYDSIPRANGVAADFVLGYTDFTSNALAFPPTANSFSNEQTISTNGTRVAIGDAGNKRVLLYNSVPTANNVAADVVVGQLDFVTATQSCSATSVSSPQSVFIVGTKLFIPDSGHHRILVYNSIPVANGAAADLVLGQADFTHCVSNQGGPASATTMSNPGDVWSDGTRLIVVDSSNSRLLIWNTFPTVDDQAADVVIGQSDFTGSSSGLTASTLNNPSAVFSSGTQLFVSDGDNNRVLIWNTIPSTNGAAADAVLGQADFISNTAATTASGMNFPAGIYLSGKQLFVTEVDNNRVTIFQGN